MNTIPRNFDVSLGEPDLELLYTVPRFPVFLGCVDTRSETDEFCDLNYWISQHSGTIQVNPLLPLDIIYQSDHRAGTTGTIWMQHHAQLAAVIARYNPQHVFEIGGGHGILNSVYKLNTNWTIVEPNPTPVTGCTAKFQKEFFSAETRIPETVDMIVHSHVLEHVYEPEKFFKALTKLPTGIRMVFSIPNMLPQLKKYYTNVIMFEHSYFCTEDLVDNYLNRFGFKILDKTYYGDDHSIFYAVERVDLKELPMSSGYENNYTAHKQLFDDFMTYHEHMVSDLNAKINKVKSNTNIYIFGAHMPTLWPIALGLDTDRIVSILDNSTDKQGKRLYGTDLKVQAPECLAGQKAPIVILLGNAYAKEIKAGILRINADTVFFE